MVLNLAERLEVPLRERNTLLLAAGYAPAYTETPLDAEPLASVRAAVRQVLHGHEPYPAVMVDGYWNLVETNVGMELLLEGVAPDLLAPPANGLRASLHPEGMAPRIVNLGEWRANLLDRLRRRIVRTADGDLARLYDELRAYPCDQPEPKVELPGPGGIYVPLRIRHGDHLMTFFSTISTFGTPLDITVAELAIESFFPADAATTAILSAHGAGGGRG